MEDKKKSGKGLVVIIVILTVLLLGAVGYICYDKFYQKENTGKHLTVETQEDLVEQNLFKLKDISCQGEKVCAKEIKISYNNKNHILKLLKKKKNSENGQYLIELYIDDQIIKEFDGGSDFWDRGDQVSINDLTGYVYVMNKKYLAVIYNIDDYKTYWNLSIFNDNQFVDTIERVADNMHFQGHEIYLKFYNKEINDEMGALDLIEFDDGSIKYWINDYKNYCESENNNVNSDKNIRINQHEVSYGGGKIDNSVINTIKGTEIGGAYPCEGTLKNLS